jgi:hypothetical protein
MKQFQIKLYDDTLAVLRGAILQGMLSHPVELLRTKIAAESVANHPNERLIDEWKKEIEELKLAADAIVNAQEYNEGARNLVQMIQAMLPGGAFEKNVEDKNAQEKLDMILSWAKGVDLRRVP